MATRAYTRNMPYLRSQAAALLGNTSPGAKLVVGAVAFGYGLSYWEPAVEALSVTPGYLLPPAFRLWTTFTFCFLELHLWEVLVDAATIGLCGKLIEPLWGPLEMVKFFCITNVGVAYLTTAYYLLIYACSGEASYLFDIRVHGLAGYIAAVCVAVKQIMPDHLLVKTPLGKLTNRSLPLLLLLVSIVLWLVGALEGAYPCMWACGSIVSWVYLRFWQRHSNGTRGDVADSFGFDNFFPTVIQPLIRAVLSPLHRCVVRIGLCPAAPRRVHLALSPRGITISMPGVDQQNVERRRQIALKALSERLSKTSEQSRQKNVSSKLNMEAVRKMQASQVIPPFQSPEDEHPSSSGSLNPAAPVNEATLINIESTVQPSISKQS